MATKTTVAVAEKRDSTSALAFFPINNFVYVDLDATELSDQGHLAYTTVEAAYASWRPTGAAYVLYGVPSVTNRPGIVIGIGTFTPVGTITHDVPYLTVKGSTDNALNHEITISSSGALFDQTVDNAAFVNLRLTNTGSGTVFQVNDAIAADSDYYNLDGSGSAGLFGGNYFINNSSGNISGRWKRIKLYAHSGHGLMFGFVRNFLAEDWEIFYNLGGAGPLDIDADRTVIFRNTRLTGDADDNSAFLINNGGHVFDGIIDGMTVEAVDLSFLGTSGGNTAGIGGFITGLRGGANGLALFTQGLCAGFEFTGTLDNSRIGVTNAHTDACHGGDGSRFTYSRIIGTGNGLAISNMASVTIEIAQCELRMPNGDIPGSSVSGSIDNSADTPFNTELLAATLA